MNQQNVEQNNLSPKRVLLGMSGGLDSTFAVVLLREAGYEVEGAVLAMHEYSEVEEAEKSAQALDVPLHVIDCRQRFRTCVQEPFMDTYLCGKTPNPCIFCNRDVKFAALHDFAVRHGFDRIATGHYCRVEKVGERYAVCRADDLKKDQSYVLWRLSQEQLSMLITPLSAMSKAEVRARAEAMGLSVAHKKESQEICFIPDKDYARFIEERRGKLPGGEILDWNGKVVGHHNGLLHYTVGQRKHLGVALGEPVYVREINPEKNQVILARAGNEYADTMTVDSLLWQGLEMPKDETPFSCTVKTRYGATPAPCTVSVRNGIARVGFDAPVRAVTPGQSAVFYDGARLLFGGYIC